MKVHLCKKNLLFNHFLKKVTSITETIRLFYKLLPKYEKNEFNVSNLVVQVAFLPLAERSPAEAEAETRKYELFPFWVIGGTLERPP